MRKTRWKEGDSVPEKNRDAVRMRSRARCERCGVLAVYGHWHHRRSRRVKDEHRHEACNGVWLCATCHQWAHHSPVTARREGWIVSQWVDNPGTVPVETAWGSRLHDCEGGFEIL